MKENGVERLELADGIECFVRDGAYLAAIRSSLCFPVPIDGSSKRSTADLDRLKFELENDVPVDAESIAFDLLDSGEGSLAIAVNAEDVAARIRESEQLADKACLAVVPVALLALQPIVREHSGVVVVEALDSLDVFQVEAGKVSSWRWLPANADMLKQTVHSCQTPDKESASVLFVRCDAGGKRALENLQETIPDCLHAKDCANDLAFAQVDKILRGSDSPLVNLCNGRLSFVDINRLARPASLVFGACLVGVLLLVAAGLYQRGRAYRSETDRMSRQQEEIFSRLFPNQQIPVGMMGRIESEHRRLAATKKSGGVPDVGSALPVMRAFWNALPTDARYNANFLHFQPNLLRSIDGSAKSYADLERLRTVLQEASFDIPPTSASKTTQGVTLRWERVAWTDQGPKEKQTLTGEPVR